MTQRRRSRKRTGKEGFSNFGPTPITASRLMKVRKTMTITAANKGFEVTTKASIHAYEAMKREYAVSRRLGYSSTEAAQIAGDLGQFIMNNGGRR
jgi:hypothetical protein